ncbi:MAG: histidinol-phosphatase HisJ family protein [Candidatus Thorarchaeota archaeon]
MSMQDYHIHPNYSLDAEGTLSDFCEAALLQGIEEIAFTTHLDTDKVAEDCVVSVGGKLVDVQSPIWFEDYEKEIRSVAEKYNDRGLSVLVGAEVDIYPEVVENIPSTFYDVDWDIVIGSVHLVDHLAISTGDGAHQVFSKYNAEDLGNVYFMTLIDTIGTSLIDILGHLDLYRRYGESFFGEEIHDIWRPYINELVGKMKKHRVGFEINTSSWRKGQNEPMPSTELLNALCKNGIDTVTLGSDAHRPQEVGYGIPRALHLLENNCSITPSKYRKRKKM